MTIDNQQTISSKSIFLQDKIAFGEWRVSNFEKLAKYKDNKIWDLL